MRRLLKVIVVGFMITSVCSGQDPAIQVSMNDEAKFILSGSNVSTLGVEFFSQSSSLATIPENGDGELDTSPFEFALSNSPSTVTLVSLPPAVIIDGSVTLKAGWNSNGYKDVTYAFGDRGSIMGPYSISADAHRGICADCETPPLQPIAVNLNDDLKFQLLGRGHQLRSFQFESGSGSLSPAASAAPFETLSVNTPDLIQYQQAGASVMLDGTVTLNSGWNDFIGGRDVRFQYEVAEGQEVDQGPFPLQKSAYPQAVSWTLIAASFDDQNRVVISGAGHPLVDFKLSSSSGSLIPDDNPGPFASVSGTATEVIYSALENQFVTLDGDLTLGTRWNFGEPGTAKDVRYTYDLVGNTINYFQQINSRNYPAERSWPRIAVTLDDEDRFVINGAGHPLKGFNFNSRSGSLITSDEPGPFEALTSNTNTAVEYSSNENVILDGSLTLGTAWNRKGEKDVRYGYDLDKVSRDAGQFAVSSQAYPVVPLCFDGRDSLGVHIDSRNRFVIRGNGQQFSGLELSSESGGLVPGDSPDPFESLDSNTSALVQYASSGLVKIDGQVILSTSWDPSKEKDVQFDFGNLIASDSIYPFCINPVTGEVVDPGTGLVTHSNDFIDVDGSISGPNNGGGDLGNSARLFGQINSDGLIEIIAANGPVGTSGINIRSADGKLKPIAAPDPFLFFLSNTDSSIVLATVPGVVTLDGIWNTGIEYLGDSPHGDLSLAFGGAGGVEIVFPLAANEVVPEPNSSLLLIGALTLLVSLRKRAYQHGNH